MKEYKHLVKGVGEEVPSPALGKVIVEACKAVYGDLEKVPFPILVTIGTTTFNHVNENQVGIEQWCGNDDQRRGQEGLYIVEEL